MESNIYLSKKLEDMTPKQKALELMNRFYDLDNVCGDVATQCAIIAVESIMSEIYHATKYLKVKKSEQDDVQNKIDFWKQVKQELEKML